LLYLTKLVKQNSIYNSLRKSKPLLPKLNRVKLANKLVYPIGVG